MKNFLSSVVWAGLILSMFGFWKPAAVSAEVYVNVNFPLPGIVIPGPPGMVVIPGSYVYYPADVDADIFFYHGYWYRPYRGGWYIANGYNGPWRSCGPGRVPRAVVGVRPSYRRIPPGQERLAYRSVQTNWRTWENERRWDKHSEHGHEQGEKHGREEGMAKEGTMTINRRRLA